LQVATKAAASNKNTSSNSDSDFTHELQLLLNRSETLA